MRFAQYLYECSHCQIAFESWHWDYESVLCPQCSEPMPIAARQVPRAPAVIPDDIPGGMLIRHGICHADGSPRKFYSKSEIRETARKAGWTIDGETPLPRERREV